MIYTKVPVCVSDQVMSFETCPKLASGGVDVIRIDFTFCPMWEGFAKTAVFYRPGGKAYHVLLVDDKAVVPQEVLTSAGSVMFSVFGVNAEGQTRPASILELKVERGAITQGAAVKDPTPSIYEQILAQLAELENGGGTGGGGVTVDDALSETSENPVQNKVITVAFNQALADITQQFAEVQAGLLPDASEAPVDAMPLVTQGGKWVIGTAPIVTKADTFTYDAHLAHLDEQVAGLQSSVGNIDTALDELHSYAENLVNGGAGE